MKKQKGITLIALVITIIVLLILVAVSIATLTGKNGILTQAQNSKEETEKANVIERAQIDVLGKKAESIDGSITKSEFKEILKKYFEKVPEELPEDLTTLELKSKEEYGGHLTKVSEIYSGTLKKEKEPIEITESYIADFADMNNDGVADGIIYADLAVGGSGQWYDEWGNYSYEPETGLKEYYIENENYTEPEFGNMPGKLIAPIEGTSGKNRFYVMALKDINPGTYYCWYDEAYGKLDKEVPEEYNDFGAGKENTEYVMNKFDLGETEGGWGPQNKGRYDDMWGVEELRNKVNEGWFVPSKSEWAAFADMTAKTLGFNMSNFYYREYGLSDYYWSSSQLDEDNAHGTDFYRSYMSANSVNKFKYVRMSTTF